MTIYLEVRAEFEEVPWEEVEANDVVYYQVRKDPSAHGPFIVVDPTIGRLRNQQGVELNLPQMQLLRMKV